MTEAILENDSVTKKMDIGGTLLGFRAEGIRKQKTGVHAMVSIYSGPHLLGYDTFNLGRLPDRKRLAKACATDELPESVMHLHLDDFCSNVWSTWVAQFAPKQLEPDLANLTPLSYYLKPYVIDGGGTILFAPPGSAKSYAALLMAQSINANYGGIWNVEHGRVLYINLERSALSLERRLMLVNTALGLEVQTPMLMSNARGKTLAHVVESLGQDFDVVVVDSLSRSGSGSMVDDEAANAVMDQVNNMCDTWLLIAHTPRADTSHTFGSQMFDAAADLTLSLKSARNANDELGVQIEGHKSNDAPIPKAATYCMTFNEYGLEGFRTAIASEFPKLIEGSEEDRVEMIREYLMNNGESGINDIVDGVGASRSSVQRDLRSVSGLGQRRSGNKLLYTVGSVGQ